MEIDGTMDNFKYSLHSDWWAIRRANMPKCAFDPKKKNSFWGIGAMDDTTVGLEKYQYLKD